MPLIDSNTRKCLICLHEYTIGAGQWAVSNSDPHVFFSPPCPKCGSEETFFNHDEIYTKPIRRELEIPPLTVDGPKRFLEIVHREPNHEDPRAQHMVLIEEVATKLKVKKKAVDKTPAEFTYKAKPTKPDKDKHRKWVEQLNVDTVQTLKDEAWADDQYEKQVAYAGIEMEENTQYKEERKRAKAARREANKDKVVEEPQVIDQPDVDKLQRKVRNLEGT